MISRREKGRLLILVTVLSLGLLTTLFGALAQSGPPPSASGTAQNDDEGVLLTFSAADHSRPGDLTPSYTGIAKERDLITGTTISIDIDCLQVVGNIAIMSGPILRAPEGIPVGVDMVFVVQDNGEGVNAVPDTFSRFQPLTKGRCNQVKLAVPKTQSQRGDIQVRGGESSSCPPGFFPCPGCPGQCTYPGGPACTACQAGE